MSQTGPTLCPPLLLSVGRLHRGPVPQPFPEQWSPRGQFSCSQTHAPMKSLSVPTAQSRYFGSLGFLDHCCFVLMCCTMVCSGSQASHRPFGDWCNVFSRIRVIQTSCTYRLKSCNPQLHAHSAVSVCQWLLNHTPESLQTVRLICTHSPAACQQVLHFQP